LRFPSIFISMTGELRIVRAPGWRTAAVIASGAETLAPSPP
jgi:hypothetical protein